MLRIELPWPPAELSQNARGHWRVKENARKSYKWAAQVLALNAWAEIGKPRFRGMVKLDAVFYPPQNRRYDDDNLIGRIKYARDGIAAAIGCDDALFRQQAIAMGPVVKGGKVVLTLTPCGPHGLGIDGGDG